MKWTRHAVGQAARLPERRVRGIAPPAARMAAIRRR